MKAVKEVVKHKVSRFSLHNNETATSLKRHRSYKREPVETTNFVPLLILLFMTVDYKSSGNAFFFHSLRLQIYLKRACLMGNIKLIWRREASWAAAGFYRTAGFVWTFWRWWKAAWRSCSCWFCFPVSSCRRCLSVWFGWRKVVMKKSWCWHGNPHPTYRFGLEKSRDLRSRSSRMTPEAERQQAGEQF